MTPAAGGGVPPDPEQAIRDHAPAHAQALPVQKGAAARLRAATMPGSPMSVMGGGAQ